MDLGVAGLKETGETFLYPAWLPKFSGHVKTKALIIKLCVIITFRSMLLPV
jgi:hypothetical protein